MNFWRRILRSKIRTPNPPKKEPSKARARRKGGVGGIPPRPEPVPLVSADAQCNGVVNILDATYLISSLYKGGPDPCQGP